MDEYLSDKEQVERLRQWWRENGWFLIGGVALGLLGLYAYNQYFAYRDRQSEAAAELYAAVQQEVDDGDREEAESRFAELRGEFPEHAYTYQAALLVASAEVVSEPDGAIEKLRYAMQGTDDPELAMIARLRLARVLAYREQYGEALALLEVPDAGQFAGLMAEIRGDIQVALGETDAARSAYLEALVASGAELLDRSLLQMKLADLPSPGSAQAEAVAPADGAPSTEEPAAASPAEVAPEAGASADGVAPGDDA